MHTPPTTRRNVCSGVFLALCALVSASNAYCQISFATVVDLALNNSPQVRVGSADVQRAEAGVMVGVAAYKPSLLIGSSLGYSYGFPVGQPSIYSVSAQSLAFSFSQPDYIRSARLALQSSQMQLSDARQQTILQTALDYIELNKLNLQIAALDRESTYVDRLVEIEDDRVNAGTDSRISQLQARLQRAQIDVQRIKYVNQAVVLRSKLAHLTGLHPGDLQTEAQTIPPPPKITQASDLGGEVSSSNQGVRAAYAMARSKQYTAFGDQKQNNRPTIGFGGEYNRYAKFNNYSEYYLRFQHNNFNVGLQVTIPFFDATRKARAKGSSAEAVHAGAEADLLRNQTQEQALALQKSLEELAAEEHVAELESELAQEQVTTVTTQLNSGNGGNASEPLLTPKDEQTALINERVHYIELLDVKFSLTEAQLTLLRSLGKIEDWAKSNPPPAAP